MPTASASQRVPYRFAFPGKESALRTKEELCARFRPF
jgi:hypothetical protein